MDLAEQIGVHEAARELGIPVSTLKTWRQKFRPASTIEAASDPRRDEHGRWLPGVSGNPSGKRNVVVEVRRRLEDLSEQAVDELLKIARDPKTPATVRERIYNSILDRALGKPRQAMDINSEVENNQSILVRQIIDDPHARQAAEVMLQRIAGIDEVDESDN